jgi:hypothetical protein
LLLQEVGLSLPLGRASLPESAARLDAFAPAGSC